jgi:hypothetical protein
MKKEKAILNLIGGSGGRDRSGNTTNKGDTITIRGGSGGSVSVNSVNGNSALTITGGEMLRRALNMISDEK